MSIKPGVVRRRVSAARSKTPQLPGPAHIGRILADELRQAGRVRLLIGSKHVQAVVDDEVEVLIHEFPETGDEAVIFHVMPLGPKFRRYRQEHPQ